MGMKLEPGGPFSSPGQSFEKRVPRKTRSFRNYACFSMKHKASWSRTRFSKRREGGQWPFKEQWAWWRKVAVAVALGSMVCGGRMVFRLVHRQLHNGLLLSCSLTFDGQVLFGLTSLGS